MRLQINLNDEIEVELSDAGKWRIDDYYKNLGMSKPARHDGKIITIQLWEFVQIFGNMCRMGADVPTKDNLIYIRL